MRANKTGWSVKKFIGLLLSQSSGRGGLPVPLRLAQARGAGGY
jgi:hypothetical protein